MTRTLRSYHSLALVSALVFAPLAVACDDGGAAAKATADAAKADAKRAEAKKEEAKKAAPKPKAKAKDPLALPWDFDGQRNSLKRGAVLEYAQSGKNAKGKSVKDTYRCQVKSSDPKTVGTVCVQVEHPSKDPGAGQVATTNWGTFSPFFAVEKPKHEISKREKVTVAAGEFDCLVVELKGFMGNHRTVWMAVDKPGVYAKVVDHGNANSEGDKTEMTYELAKLEVPG